MICPICGAEFERRGQQKYCSKKCKDKAVNRYSQLLKPREGKLKRRECENCGKTFETTSNEHFCSDECRIQYFHLDDYLEAY